MRALEPFPDLQPDVLLGLDHGRLGDLVGGVGPGMVARAVHHHDGVEVLGRAGEDAEAGPRVDVAVGVEDAVDGRLVGAVVAVGRLDVVGDLFRGDVEEQLARGVEAVQAGVAAHERAVGARLARLEEAE